MNFIQLNTKKAMLAAVELNKRVLGYENYVALITEPYVYKGKIDLPPMGDKIISAGNNPRAVIFADKNSNIIGMEGLSSRDCAAGLLKFGDEYVLIASIYLDIKMKVVQPCLDNLIAYANKKNYAVLIGICLLYTSPSPRD